MREGKAAGPRAEGDARRSGDVGGGTHLGVARVQMQIVGDVVDATVNLHDDLAAFLRVVQEGGGKGKIVRAPVAVLGRRRRAIKQLREHEGVPSLEERLPQAIGVGGRVQFAKRRRDARDQVVRSAVR